MTEYTLSLTILGKDKVSGLFDHIDRSLKSIMNTALGVVIARVIEDIAQAVGKLGLEAINAVAYVQVLQLTLEALATRELVQLSDGMLTVADVTDEATEMAAGLMHELGRMAILSPYTLEATTNIYRMMVAFGSTTSQAKQLTGGLMTMGAGLGAANEQIQRMGYNLAQVALQGKVTALDIRQLALAGLPLTDILQAVGDKFGIVIKDHLDFNDALKEGKITWQDFVDTFEEYATTNFGGSSEKLARSLYGLKSTFGDVFALTMPRLLGQGVDEVTKILSRLLDSFLYLYDAPELTQMGEMIGARMKAALLPVSLFVNRFVDRIERGFTLKDALTTAFNDSFGGTLLGKAVDFFGQLMTRVGQFIDFFAQVFQLVSPILQGTFGTIRGLMVDTLLPILSQVATAAMPLVEMFAVGAANAFDGLIPIIDTLVATVLPPLIESLSGVLTALLPVAEQVLPIVAGVFSDLIIAIMPLITTLLPVAAQVFATLVTAMLPLVDTVVVPLIGFIGELVQAIAPFIAEYLPMVADYAVQIITALMPIITTLLPPLLDILLQLAVALTPLILSLIPPLAQILLVVADAIVTYLLPVVLELVSWLQINLPVAIQWLTDMWNTVLLPALSWVAAFISGTLVPIIVTIFTWIGTNLPIAIQWLTDMWNNTLLPALTTVWDFLNATLFPLLSTIADFIVTVFNKNLEIFSGWWSNFILPALQAIVSFSEEHLLPIFQSIVDFYKNTFFAVLKTFKEKWLDGIKKSFDNIVTAVTNVINFLRDLKDIIANIKLPDWLTPGSPTPFEYGLLGIGSALQDLTRAKLPQFETALRITSAVKPQDIATNLISAGSNTRSSPSVVIEKMENIIQSGYETLQYSIDRAKAEMV